VSESFWGFLVTFFAAELAQKKNATFFQFDFKQNALQARYFW